MLPYILGAFIIFLGWLAYVGNKAKGFQNNPDDGLRQTDGGLSFTSELATRKLESPETPLALSTAIPAANVPLQLKQDSFELVMGIKNRFPDSTLTWKPQPDQSITAILSHPDGNAVAATGKNVHHANLLLSEKLNV